MNSRLIDLIEQKLGKHPDIRYVRWPGYLEVPATTPSGFRVYVAADGTRATRSASRAGMSGGRVGSGVKL